MAKGNAKVAFGRINRRSVGQATLDRRPFAEDMRQLADSHETKTQLGDRRWIASDLQVRDNGDTMVGLLGFEVEEQVRTFAEEDFSWIKGTTQFVQGAQTDTVVPFAVDLREHRRWVAVATSARIQHTAFARGLQAVLNAAVEKLGLLTTDWEVDMITSSSNVIDWVAEHSGIKLFKRTVKFSNPGRDLGEDKALMRAIHATVKDEEYRALGGDELQLSGNPVFRDMLDGMDRGDVAVRLEARDQGGRHVYTSKDRPDTTFIDAFNTLEDGMESVMNSLRAYSSRQTAKLDDH